MNTAHTSPSGVTRHGFAPENLQDFLKLPVAPDSQRAIEEQFDLWSKVVDSLPLTLDDYVFARNWVCSAQRLWQQGESKAAAYQLRQVAKRLHAELKSYYPQEGLPV